MFPFVAERHEGGLVEVSLAVVAALGDLQRNLSAALGVERNGGGASQVVEREHVVFVKIVADREPCDAVMAFSFLIDIENQVQAASALGAVAGNENLVAIDAFGDAAVPALQGVGANKPHSCR